jgi:dUTP pyrophosphatase
MIKEVKGNELYFAKLNDSVIIPTKDDENGGWDIYANFEGNSIIIFPHETVMIPTGLLSAFSEDYVVILKERGSTGTKGIAQRCGVIDSGFRGQWQVPITNTNEVPIIIAKDVDKAAKMTFNDRNGVPSQKAIIYPYSKAICQAIVVPVPRMSIREISPEELQCIPSKRKDGMLGSSQK